MNTVVLMAYCRGVRISVLYRKKAIRIQDVDQIIGASLSRCRLLSATQPRKRTRLNLVRRLTPRLLWYSYGHLEHAMNLD